MRQTWGVKKVLYMENRGKWRELSNLKLKAAFYSNDFKDFFLKNDEKPPVRLQKVTF